MSENSLIFFADYSELFAAMSLFLGGHLLLSSRNLRHAIISEIGEKYYRGLYSALSLAALVWVGVAYGRAPLLVLWAGEGFSPLLQAVMPLAVFFWITGLTTKSPTAIGGEVLLDDNPDPTPGILRITRHPVMWAIALWATGHALVNGTLGGLILFGGLAVLALAGMWHIDQRRAAKLGAAWGPIALTTSCIPFVALITGRCKMDWTGIGWKRPLAALVIYAALLVLHGPVLGSALI